MRLFQIMFFGSLISKISRRNVKCLSSKPNQQDLTILSNLLESGKISPFIFQRCNLSEVPTAILALEQRQVMGKIAIAM